VRVSRAAAHAARRLKVPCACHTCHKPTAAHLRWRAGVRCAAGARFHRSGPSSARAGAGVYSRARRRASRAAARREAVLTTQKVSPGGPRRDIGVVRLWAKVSLCQSRRRETGKCRNAPALSSPRDSTIRVPSQSSTSQSWSSRATAPAVGPKTSSPEKCTSCPVQAPGTSELNAPNTDSLNDEPASQRTMNVPWFPASRSPFPYHSSHKKLALPKALVHMRHLANVPQHTAENLKK
jgi:hypothetical protein